MVAINGLLATGGDRGALPAKPVTVGVFSVVVDVGIVDEGGAPRGTVVVTRAAGVPAVAVAGAPGFESSFEGSIVVVEVVELVASQFKPSPFKVWPGSHEHVNDPRGRLVHV